MSSLSLETIKSLTASTPPAIQDSAGTEIGKFCRAWINLNGTGTIAIRGSFNVSSITDGGAGVYTVNFTNAMPDANYSVNITAQGAGGTAFDGAINSTAAGSFITHIHGSAASSAQDSSIVCACVFR